jgi:hypothetical protein
MRLWHIIYTEIVILSIMELMKYSFPYLVLTCLLSTPARSRNLFYLAIHIIFRVKQTSLCNHTSKVWYGSWPALHGWVQSFSKLLRELWVKCTTSAKCKTDRSVVLTVKSGLDPHMIIKLKDGLKSRFSYGLEMRCFLMLKWVGMNLHLITRHLLIKFYQH